MTIEFLLRRAAAGDRGHCRSHGDRSTRWPTGDPRPARRRLPPLCDRRRLARPALRADALRQRPARSYLPPRLGLTGERRYREVATGVLDYVLRELTTSDGAFAASQDADTEGEEGLTFTWRADEVRAALGEDAALFATAYGVTDGGNWEGVSILSRVRPTADLAKLYGIPGSGVEATLARAREKLLAIRATRPQPARDDKALASWNGLAIAALADAARLLGFQGDGAADAARYREAAERLRRRSSRGCLARMAGSAGRGRTAGRPGRASWRTMRSADGLLALYEATFDERWFTTSRRLGDAILERSPIPKAGSSTPRPTTRDSSRGQRTSRTTPPRRGARWRRGSFCSSPRSPASRATARPPTGRSRRSRRTRRAIRPRSRCGSRPST